MRKHILLVTVSLLAGINAFPAAAKDKIVAATWLPPQHQYSRYLYTYWAEKLKDISNGALTADVELGSARVSPKGNLQEIADGLVDVSGHFAQYTPSDLPVANAVEEIGMTLTDPRVVMAAATDFNTSDAEALAEWKSHGVVYGSSYTTNFYKLICNKEISDLAELKGAKLRLPGRAPAEWATQAGAVTVSFNTNEQYGALDKGALTCTTTTAADAQVRKLYEVAKYITDLPITLFWGGLGHGYNPQTWSELTVDQRKYALYAEAEAMAALMVEGTLHEEVSAQKKLESEGVIFVKPKQDLIDSLSAYRKTLPEKALEVASETFGIKDPKELQTRFQAKIDKWTTLLKDVPVDDQDAYANLMKTEIYDKLDLTTYGLN